MIFRLSQKLNFKIKAGTLPVLPPEVNPFADWSAHLFLADRTQYIILSNTKSLYSTLMYGKGTTNDRRFIERALSSIREFMEDDGQKFIYHRFIAPTGETACFAKALNIALDPSARVTLLMRAISENLTPSLEKNPSESAFSYTARACFKVPIDNVDSGRVTSQPSHWSTGDARVLGTELREALILGSGCLGRKAFSRSESSLFLPSAPNKRSANLFA